MQMRCSKLRVITDWLPVNPKMIFPRFVFEHYKKPKALNLRDGILGINPLREINRPPLR